MSKNKLVVGHFFNRKNIASVLDFLARVHDAGYLSKKAEAFKSLTRFTSVLALAFVLASVAFDYAVQKDIGFATFRLVALEEIVVIVWIVATWNDLTRRRVMVIGFFAPLVLEFLNIQRLGLLDQGAVYGMGTFIYFFLFVPMLFISQPLLYNIVMLVLVAVTPMLFASVGVSIGFDWAIYNAYVWVALGPVLAITFAAEYLILNLFAYRADLETEVAVDGLTRLSNRRSFISEAERQLALHGQQKRPASLLFIDIDHFKTINDDHGHDLGDSALERLADVLNACARDSDIISRYGGDEFVVFLTNSEQEEAERVATRVSSRIRQTPIGADTRQTPVFLSVSIGVATMSPVDASEAVDIDAFIKVADRALYEVKRRGRGRTFCFDFHDCHDCDEPPEGVPVV